ncbi:hypothetical protein PAHAL_2G166000 [Panicum hallii]|uniref:Uncharacterized protein n=1 Tax=Panicum hallii TaxID=206008 RepID=A0A2T8KPF1_9POAL|nr:BAG domain-containing protein Samui-like [Panicum hallii]PVH64019.1 hypothetical protein PAHAL_2G166000 [Panicum hallii]
MINAEPKIWAKLIKDNPKVSKFRKKAFPLFNSLGSLYEGDLNFTSSEPAPQRTQQQVDPTPQRTQQQVDPTPQRTQQQIDPIPQRSISEQSTHNTAPSRNPFNSGLDGIESTEVQSAATNQSSEDVEGVSGKKRKQSQMATGLGDYIEFRKDQIEKTMKELNEKKKHEEDYSVQKCIDIMDAMEELTDEQKADCNERFQSEMNSQIFVGTKNQKVRLIWLKKKISQGSRPSFGHGGGSAFGSGASSMV